MNRSCWPVPLSELPAPLLGAEEAKNSGSIDVIKSRKSLFVQRMRRLTIHDLHLLARKRRGRCLSKVYSNAHAKLRWCCAEGHEWTASVTSIRNGNSWCPTCAGHKPLTLTD